MFYLDSLSSTIVEIITSIGIITTDNVSNATTIITKSNSINDTIISFVKNGGLLIDLNGTYTKELTNKKNKQKFITSINSTSILHYPIEEQVDIFQFVKVINKKDFISIIEIEKGAILFWGIDLDKTISSTKIVRKQFYIPFRRSPAEEVSLISKGEILSLFEYCIKELLFRKNKQFIQKAYYEGENPPLLFRIDTDFASIDKVQKWQKIAKKIGIKTSWYLHTETHIGWIEQFTENSEDEIGVHCYSHVANMSKQDYFKAKDEIKKININPKGFVSPYGIYHNWIKELYDNNEIEYSSEFEYIYNSIPLETESLQIPIFPICINSLLSYNVPEDMIVSFFKDRIDLELYKNKAVVLYDHLSHTIQNRMGEILKYARDKGLQPLTFLEYSQFWKERNKSKVEIIDNKIISDSYLWRWCSHSNYDILLHGKRVKSVKKDIPKRRLHNKMCFRFNPKILYISYLNRTQWRKYE